MNPEAFVEFRKNIDPPARGHLSSSCGGLVSGRHTFCFLLSITIHIALTRACMYCTVLYLRDHPVYTVESPAVAHVCMHVLYSCLSQLPVCIVISVAQRYC